MAFNMPAVDAGPRNGTSTIGRSGVGEIIKLTTSDGVTINAYKAHPEGTPKAGVVVIHEVFGLNNWIRGVVDRYAGAGYLAVCPATMDRAEPGYVTDDYSQATFAKVGRLMQKMDPAKTMLDVEAAIREVASAGKVGITGFCFGGAVTWRAAHAGMGLAAASGYYGGGIPNYIELKPAIPLEMHYGDHDHGIPLEQIEQLRARYPQVPIYIYPCDHGFANSDRPGNYDKDSAEKAWARTQEFFATHLS